MCNREKAQRIINEIDDALHDIHTNFGTSKNFGYSFFPNKETGEIIRISLTIPACPDIDPSLPVNIVNWRPEKIEKKLLPILRSLTA